MQPTFIPHFNPGFNIDDISEEMRDKALKRTALMLEKFEDLRRAAALPVDQLPMVIDIYGKVVFALIAEAQREELAKHTKRLPMTMQSQDREFKPMKVAPGKTFDVIVRPNFQAYRPEDFAIHSNRSHWLVHDIRIGNRQQFAGKRAPTPGTEFGPGGVLEHMKLDTIQTAMDFVLEVEYVGPNPEGEVFECTVIGTAVEF